MFSIMYLTKRLFGYYIILKRFLWDRRWVMRMNQQMSRKRDVANKIIRNVLLFLDDQMTPNEFNNFNNRMIRSIKDQMALELTGPNLIKRFN